MFLSHTSELCRYPEPGPTYLEAAERAVSALGHCPVHMGGFRAEDQPPAAVCEGEVRGCEVYVGIIGLLYGSPVRERPQLSYTELEFETATARGMPRLVFLLDRASDLRMPGDALSDLKHGPRQEAFRQRLRDREDLTLRVVRNPDHLGQEVERALRQLAERPLATGGARLAGAGPVGWDALAEASVGGKAAADWLRKHWLLPHLPDRGRQDQALNEALERLRPSGRARPLTVITYGGHHQELDLYYDRFWESNLPEVIPSEIGKESRTLLWDKLSLREDFDKLFEQVVRQCLPDDLRYSDDPPDEDCLIVLRSDLDSDDWVERDGEELLERICRYWQGKGRDAWEGWRIIHWISIKVLRPEERARPGWRSRVLRPRGRWWRGSGQEALQVQRIRDRLAPGSAVSWQGEWVVVLEELGDVRRSCAESWVNELGARKDVDLTRQAIQWLREEVERFYSQQRGSGSAAIPMKQLSDFLRQRLLQAAAMR
ncbi:MAG: DUF4062 domain-containing protein [Cyanobacteriota bacterium]|nr:DUF4062 domain-containing protein [Cyanobacteriota bacterium]